VTTARRFGAATALVFAASLLGGCAWISTQGAISSERSLAAAGFQMKMATTPAQLTALQGLVQRKLFAKQRDGKVFWIYADAGYCKCIYVGTQNAYGRYQQTKTQERIAEAQENASMNWGMWGPWGPWY
jgi:hypothetical protein